MDFHAVRRFTLFPYRASFRHAPQRRRFFFRAGSDTDFVEFSVPLDSIPAAGRNCMVQQIDTSGGQRPNTWGVDAGGIRPDAKSGSVNSNLAQDWRR